MINNKNPDSSVKPKSHASRNLAVGGGVSAALVTGYITGRITADKLDIQASVAHNDKKFLSKKRRVLCKKNTKKFIEKYEKLLKDKPEYFKRKLVPRLILGHVGQILLAGGIFSLVGEGLGVLYDKYNSKSE